ncbi:RNase H family protein [Aliarcobacter skirrowii]|uniref:RNase H family protein n=1 Tax=Aliarcobacter skirrowii TaxID=28200 RepID=UPI0029B7F6FB|nr:RNase H family protein [Aliarcobacter skirrowii]MDX4012506.1 RNase H family protein [Aliarcobacter skirrowii]
MKIDKEFLNKIYYNGDLNIKQLDILNIDFSSEKNYENEILGKEISKNDSNLLMLLRGIDDLKSQEQIISNYHLIIKSHELFEKLKSKVNLEYVKGHSGVEGNELADKMAINAIKQKSIEYKSFKYQNIEEVLKIK